MRMPRSWRSWLRQPRSLLLLFFAVTVVPAGVLVWAGWRLNQQDRALDTQRLAERREQAADLIAVLLDQSLADLESRYLSGAGTPPPDGPDGFHIVELTSGEVRIVPEKSLLYLPDFETTLELPNSAFESGERAEFLEKDYAKAAGYFRQLARRSSGSVRAGALIRLGRNLRKAKRPEEALEAYSKLQSITGATADGIPADLVARRARCALLAELGMDKKLRIESAELGEMLQRGCWPITRAVYTHFENELSQWAPGVPGDAKAPPGLDLTEAVDWLFQEWQRGRAPAGASTARFSREFAGVNLTILWRQEARGIKALILGAPFIKAFSGNAMALGVRQGLRVALRSPDGNTVLGDISQDASHVTARPVAATDLPWDLLVETADPAAESQQSAARRRAVAVGLGLLLIFVAAGSYLIFRAYRQELAVAQLQNDFVAAVSHEFRTPLTSLRQLTENLAAGRVADEQRRQSYYAALARASGRLQRLVEELLDFGRMEAGVQNYEMRPLDVTEWLTELSGEFDAETAGGRGRVKIAYDPAPNGRPVTIDADAALLGRAIWNLLDNAARYSPPDSPVRLKVATRDGLVEISVKDEGIGIPADEQEHVFQKFVRGSNSARRDVKGTGLGLAIVQHVVAAHGGKVKLDSDPGKGSTFTIELPRVAGE